MGIAVLLHLAEEKPFEPLWSDDIHAEWMRDLHSRMGILIDKIEYRRGEMERAFLAANVPVPSIAVALIASSVDAALFQRRGP